MFGKDKEKKIRLTARTALALRVADQALRKTLNAGNVGWMLMNIRPMRVERAINGGKESAVFIEGIFFGESRHDFYHGSVFVRLHQDYEGVWRSTSVSVNCDGSVEGFEPSPYEWTIDSHRAYITDYEVARIESYGGFAGGVISSLCTR